MGEGEQKNKSGKKPYGIAVLLAIVLVAFIAFSGMWYQSDWASMREFTQRVYSSTEDWQGVNSQYNAMAAAFAKGDTSFTYKIASINIPVTKSRFSSMDKATCISYVLDEYTRVLMNSDSLTGIRANIHLVSGSEAHFYYLIASVVTGLLILLLLGYLFTKSSLVDFFKLVGPTVLIAGIVLIAMLYVVYAFYVDGWIASENAVYNEGLPIIASMIKEVFTYYIIGVIIVGVILTIPAIPGLLSKGKIFGDKPTK